MDKLFKSAYLSASKNAGSKTLKKEVKMGYPYVWQQITRTKTIQMQKNTIEQRSGTLAMYFTSCEFYIGFYDTIRGVICRWIG